MVCATPNELRKSRCGSRLVDCDSAERNARLRGPRGQPELVTADMDRWAAYLRGQADAPALPVIDTTSLMIEDAVAALAAHVDALIRRMTE